MGNRLRLQNSVKIHNDSVMKLEESEIPVIGQYKFLGVMFHKKPDIHFSYKIFINRIHQSPTTFMSSRP